MVKISIIVPVYNVEKTLANTLDSILNQTFNDFEIICVNDKSPDNSYKIIEEYIQKYPNISVVNHEENQGLGAARNTGIKFAKGEYLSFIDSDDTISKNFLEELYNIAKTKKADIVMCQLDTDTGSKIIANKIKPINYTKFEDKIKYLTNGSSCNKIWKTDLIKSNNITFPTGIYFEDNLFIIKALYLSKRFCSTDKASYFYYDNQASITRDSKNEAKRKASALKLILDINKFAEEQNFSNQEFETIKQFIAKSFIFQTYLDNEFINQLPDKFKCDENFLSLYRNSIEYKNFFEYIFSSKKTKDKKYKIITILGIKIKLRKN